MTFIIASIITALSAPAAFHALEWRFAGTITAQERVFGSMLVALTVSAFIPY